MLGLGSNMMKHPVTGKSIVRDGLVLQHNYNLSSVEPLSSGAASFNGTSDYIAINAKPVDTADGTYAWWSNSTQTAFQTIFSHGGNNIGTFHVIFGATGKPILYLHGNLYQYWVDTGFADDGKWHHWAVVVDVDDMTACKLYCDGVEIAQDARNVSGTVTSYGNMDIGKWNTNNEFDGYMCNFGVWSSHLSQAQIKSIMNKNYDSLSASEKTDLVSWWNLDSVIPDSTTLVYDNHHGGGETLGSELVTNGDFVTDTDWTKGTGWAISGGTANFTPSGSFINLTQSGILTSGKNYTVVYTLSNVTAGNVRARLGTQDGANLSSDGTYTSIITANGADFSIRTNGTFNGSVDSVSVKLINGNTGTLS